MKTKQKNKWIDVQATYGRSMTRASNISYFIICFLFLALACSSSSDDEPDPTGVEGGTISGTVKDANGNDYPGVEVTLQGEGMNKEQVTNSEGKFSISTKGAGTYNVTIEPPLSSTVITAQPVSVTVNDNGNAKADFVIETEPVNGILNSGSADILGELKNESGNPPISGQLIYAANVFDPPFGMLTAVIAPDDHHISLTEWEQAGGQLMADCNGSKAQVSLELEGLIPNGTYSFWLNFLNTPKSPGQAVNFATDLAFIQPLGQSNGSENVAIAEEDGSLSVSVEHGSCILTRKEGLVFVVVYHINGNTYGSSHIPDPEEISHLLFYFQ